MPEIKFAFTEQDLKAVADLPAGWYNLDIKTVVGGPGKNDPSSTTWTVSTTIDDGPFQGREIRTFLSTKMPQMSYRYLKAFGVDPKPNVEIPLEDTQGRKVEAYIIMDPTTNFPNVKDFRPYGFGRK